MTTECLNSHFITFFMLTCFFVLSSNSAFVSQESGLLEEVEQDVSDYRDVVSERGETVGHIYRKQASGSLG